MSGKQTSQTWGIKLQMVNFCFVFSSCAKFHSRMCVFCASTKFGSRKWIYLLLGYRLTRQNFVPKILHKKGETYKCLLGQGLTLIKNLPKNFHEWIFATKSLKYSFFNENLSIKRGEKGKKAGKPPRRLLGWMFLRKLYIFPFIMGGDLFKKLQGELFSLRNFTQEDTSFFGEIS